MGLNREHGNDLDAFMQFSRLFFAGSSDSAYRGMLSSLFPLFLFSFFGKMPIVLAHALWYPLLALIFLDSNRSFYKATFGKKIGTAPFLFIFIIFVEIIQSNFLNGQMPILVLALILYHLVDIRKGGSNKGILFLAFAVSLNLEASLFLLYLFFSKRYSMLFKTLSLIILFSFLLPFIFNGVGTMTFYLDLYSKLLPGILNFSTTIYWVPLLVIIGIAFLSVVSMNLWLFRNDQSSLPVELLYFPLMLITFHPLFATYSLIFLFPPLFVITAYLWEERKKLWKLKSFYLLLLTIGIYHIARLVDEPKNGYLITVVSLLLLMLLYLKEGGRGRI